MATRIFLDKAGLDALWALIKTAINTLVGLVNGKADKSHTHTSIGTGSTSVEADGSNVIVRDSNGVQVFKTLNKYSTEGKVGVEFNSVDNTVGEITNKRVFLEIETGGMSSKLGIDDTRSILNYKDSQLKLEEGRASLKSLNGNYLDIDTVRAKLNHLLKIAIGVNGKDIIKADVNETVLKNAQTESMGIRLQADQTECKFQGKGFTTTGTESKLTANDQVRLLAPEVYIGEEGEDGTDMYLNGVEIGGIIERLNVQPHVELMAIKGNLYLICDKGCLKGTESISLFRYTRSRSRYRKVNGVELQDSKYRTHSGWICPLLPQDGNTTYELTLSMNTEFRMSETKDVWLLQIQKTEDASHTHTYLSMIDGVIALDTGDNANTNNRLYLMNKKLGVRVSRDGNWITGYLPFCVRKKTMTTGTQSTGTQYGIGRWQ